MTVPEESFVPHDGSLREIRAVIAAAPRIQSARASLSWSKRFLAALWGYLVYWLQEPVLVFAGFYLAAAAIAQPFYVPSGSMQPALAIGDLLLATKYSYGYSRYSLPLAEGSTPVLRVFAKTPEPGDVIVFRKPGNEAVTLVKRVVALPGDRVQMRNGRLWINGRKLPLAADGIGKAEDGPGEGAPGAYFDRARFIETLPNGRAHPIFKKMWDGPFDNTGEYRVPQGHLFVMGDNRDDSADSRIPPEESGVGFLPLADVVGKAQLVVASVDFVNTSGVWGWPLQLRLKRLFSPIH